MFNRCADSSSTLFSNVGGWGRSEIGKCKGEWVATRNWSGVHRTCCAVIYPLRYLGGSVAPVGRPDSARGVQNITSTFCSVEWVAKKEGGKEERSHLFASWYVELLSHILQCSAKLEFYTTDTIPCRLVPHGIISILLHHHSHEIL